MRNVLRISIGLAVLAAVTIPAAADEYVNGYYKSNGTYVQGYERSSPDSSYNNNWSTSPNTNPYTFKQGTNAPTWNDKPPCPPLSSYCY